MKVDFQIIRRYLDDRGSGENRSLITSWFNDIRAEKEVREGSREYWDEIPEESVPEGYVESVILGNIYRDIKLREGKIFHSTSRSSRILSFISKVAAVLFIPLLAHFVVTNISRNTLPGETVYTEIYSPLGARTKFYLPDGSHGWLKGGSTLKFPERFEGQSREVTMSGEAYFDVVSNPRIPFEVSGKNLEIVAKGTSFNVSSWEDEPETEVALVEGLLEIFLAGKENKGRVARLEPGQLLHYQPYQTGSFVQNVNLDKYISWTEGKLVFMEDPFEDVVKEINRWYNVNLEIKDEILKTYKYVATFEDETLDEILKMLTISAPIRYRELERVQSKDGTYQKRTIELYYKPMKSE